MNLLSQYLAGATLSINIKKIVDNSFLNEVVGEYKLLLRQKKNVGLGFLEELKVLKISFSTSSHDEDVNEGFDLLFLSYLSLLKVDFPNINIEIYYPFFDEDRETRNYFFKLHQHRLHLLITAEKEIFKLFKDNVEYKGYRIVQSESYIPPLLINELTVDILFTKKQSKNNFKQLFSSIFDSIDTIKINQLERESVFVVLQKHYMDSKGLLDNWTFSDLSGLYLLKAIYDLYLLRYIVNQNFGIRSEYQIGLSIIDSKDDIESPHTFREKIYSTLEQNQVFNFNDVEAYLFSLIVQNSELFKIPGSKKEMLNKILPFLTEAEKVQCKQNFKTAKSKFIDIYNENLQRIIEYTKELSFGLHELSKNIVEHTISRHGVITARIYTHNNIILLKNLESEWVDQFDNSHKFLDINVVDSGFLSIKESYKNNLIREKQYYITNASSSEIIRSLTKEYDDDIKQIKLFDLNNFFNYNSVKLYHQINRTKARLGLLIFSQTILNEKNAFVTLASNDLESKQSSGYFLYAKGGLLIEKTASNVIPLGTYYNFIIPVRERFEVKKRLESQTRRENSISSSVFLELHSYHFEPNIGKIEKVQFDLLNVPVDKYAKLDYLKDQIPIVKSKILLINANSLRNTLINSSDWIRFLANMQFGIDHFKDVVLYNFDAEVYIEIVNILRLFDTIIHHTVGFWKQDRHVLFFIPVNYNGNVFWFNSLLCSTKYREFVRVNNEIGLYHLNFNSISDEELINTGSAAQPPKIDSLLFSKSQKLLNFELILHSNNGLSLFEETTQSLINIRIDNYVDED